MWEGFCLAVRKYSEVGKSMLALGQRKMFELFGLVLEKLSLRTRARRSR